MITIILQSEYSMYSNVWAGRSSKDLKVLLDEAIFLIEVATRIVKRPYDEKFYGKVEAMSITDLRS